MSSRCSLSRFMMLNDAHSLLAVVTYLSDGYDSDGNLINEFPNINKIELDRQF